MKRVPTLYILFALLLPAFGGNRSRAPELETMSEAFMQAFWVDKDYDEAFYTALLLEELLPRVSENEFPSRRYTYFRLGEAYYLFLDYPKSISLLENALSPTPLSFNDVTNLRALNILGICYANLGQMELSDNYFRQVLHSPDSVLNREIHNAYAVSYLGCNEMLRGNYDHALELSAAVWPVLRQTDDYGHLAGMCYCRGRSYLQRGDFKSASHWVDSLVYFARRDTYNPVKRIKQAYLLQTDFYSALGDARQTRLYADSLVGVYRASEERYTSGYIARASDRFNRERIRASEEELGVTRTRMVVVSLLALCSILVAIVIASLYRKKNAAYKALALHAREWAASDSRREGGIQPAMQHIGAEESAGQPTAEDREIMSRVHQEMTMRNAYRNPDLTVELLADTLGIHRNQLSRAVNRTTGNNFNQYVNTFRIKEAVRILSENTDKQLSIVKLYEHVGFNSRASFYRVFHQITGLSPRDMQATTNS